MKATIMLLILTLCFGVAYAVDIAFYIGQWNTDGWYDASQFDDVKKIIAQTGDKFKDIQEFEDKQLQDLGAWTKANMADGELDIIWLNGCMPGVLYPFVNKEPDGSLAEQWLDNGNMFINVGDWFAYVSYECGGRCAENASAGAANILDLAPGIIGFGGGTQMKVTPTGENMLPSLGDQVKTDRPVSIGEVHGDWEVAAIFASIKGTDDPNAAAQADPIVIHNMKTDGYLAIINQASGGPAGWIKDRGQTVAEFINNWVEGELGLLSVEPHGKLSVTWGEIKSAR